MNLVPPEVSKGYICVVPQLPSADNCKSVAFLCLKVYYSHVCLLFNMFLFHTSFYKYYKHIILDSTLTTFFDLIKSVKKLHHLNLHIQFPEFHFRIHPIWPTGSLTALPL